MFEGEYAMLVEFTVDNFKSIKDTINFSMFASTYIKNNNSNTFTIRNYELLLSAIIYGANASGKSNFLRAMAFMRNFVLNRFKILQSTDRLPHEPFELSTETEDASSKFEIIFFVKNTKYRYGFEIDSENIYAEWLFADEKGREAKLFIRDIEENDYVNPNKFKEGFPFFDRKNQKIKIAKNQLFIWKCDQEDGEISKSILKWFSNFNMIDGMDHQGYINFTLKKMEDDDFKNRIIELVKTADIDIDDISIEEDDIPLEIIESLPILDIVKKEILNDGILKSISINTKHKKYDKKGIVAGKVNFELDKEESKGTRKFFAISAPIIDTLQNGKVLIIDELDSSLHPILTQYLIRLFHDKTINKNHAQLIFATHDTNLLKPYNFRKDQIWLTEKNKYGSTDLYSLAQFKGVRAKEDFEKQYIQGKYGAIPYLGKFEF